MYLEEVFEDYYIICTQHLTLMFRLRQHVIVLSIFLTPLRGCAGCGVTYIPMASVATRTSRIGYVQAPLCGFVGRSVAIMRHVGWRVV